MAATKKDGQSEHIFVRRVLIVLGLAALLFLLWQLRIIFLMLFGAVVIATIFRAVADLICHYTRVPAGVATALSILIVLGGVIGMVALFGAQVSQQLTTLRETLPDAWAAFEKRVGDMGLGAQLDQLVASFSKPSGGVSRIGQTLMSIGGGIADLVVVIFAGIYLATQAKFYRTGVIKLVPPRRREIAEEALLESDRALRLWLKGQAIAMVVVGLMTGIGLWFLGMPSAFVLGLAAGLLEFIPFAGPIIAAIPALLLALAVSPDLALWVALLYFGIQQFEGNLLSPLVQQYAVDLPGAVLLFSLIAFGTLFGTLGVILAAPLAVVLMVMVKRLYVIETLDTPTPIPGEGKS
ncbi:AI-2E family transporter [Sphingomonas lutea]|uniref:AI-2E family transporter n=1 Tax=Sphingomonas lutea TaxID=1045317 RepID=A0A7G9SGK4_9SPHN|nr:AI-2E family transporter [Sphingomonas lutea]QNN66979.1 AI-2E family transporter [Sphingomonas lutea]